MPDYYYQIKGKGPGGYWSWPPLHSGMIAAANTKEARKLVEEEYGMKLPGSTLKKDGEHQLYLLSFMDMTEKPYLYERFTKMTCDWCKREYTLNDKYLLNAGGSHQYCSIECANDFKVAEAIREGLPSVVGANDFNGIHVPVIYKITNKITGKCYIGKTTQAFTLRWYQHFYQNDGGTKFHAAIREYGADKWTFEIIELVEIPPGTNKFDRHRFMLERETYWMNECNSINDGYNSAVSLKAEEPDNQPKLFDDAFSPEHEFEKMEEVNQNIADDRNRQLYMGKEDDLDKLRH